MSDAPLVVTRVSDEGLSARGDREGVYDVLFDGRRVWSFWFLRDSAESEPGERFVEWPESLRRYLDGYADLVVREHLSERVVFDKQIRLGTRDEPIAIIDREGHTLGVDKSGRLQRMFAEGDDGVVAPLMDAIDEVLTALHDIGIAAFPAYGTLLGAVRDGALIGHDSDADLAYLSEHTHPIDVMRESYRIERELRGKGYRLQRYSGFSMKIFVTEKDGAVRGLDLFGGAIFAGTLYVMGEIAAQVTREQVLPLGTCTLEGRTFPAPADPDAWLVATYGPSWRVPDPAFHFETPQSTHRRLNGWFRGTRRHRDDWDGFWGRRAGKAPRKQPSDLQRWVHELEPAADVFVDLGCGRGADSLWHARAGRRAIGLDYSLPSYRDAARVAAREDLPAEFAELNLCDLRSTLATGAWLSHLDGRVVLTARQLADSLDPWVRARLWRLCKMVARNGQRAYLECLDGDDPRAAAYAAERLLMPLGSERLLNEISAAGGTVVRREVVEPEEGNRPRLNRLVVTWE